MNYKEILASDLEVADVIANTGNVLGLHKSDNGNFIIAQVLNKKGHRPMAYFEKGETIVIQDFRFIKTDEEGAQARKPASSESENLGKS